MRVPSSSDRIYACARQFTMNLRMHLIIARLRACARTYVLSIDRIYEINYAYKACVNVLIFTKTGSFTRIFPPGLYIEISRKRSIFYIENANSFNSQNIHT